jgi:hypothetical protein
MTEFLEVINAEVMEILGDECLFSHEDGEHKLKNDLSNSPSKLRTKLGATKGEPIQFTFELDGTSYKGELGFNAHHVLPADAAVNKATALLKEMKKSGHLKGDVGYGVNHKNNGVFLPTDDRWNVAKFGKWSTMMKKQDGYRLLYAYAYWAMKKTGKQFHTAHPDYNRWTKQRLEEIRVKMLEMKEDCDKCEKKNAKEPFNPPYEIVDKLDAIAEHVRGYLTGSSRRWLYPLVTSPEAEFFGAGITPDTMAAV